MTGRCSWQAFTDGVEHDDCYGCDGSGRENEAAGDRFIDPNTGVIREVVFAGRVVTVYRLIDPEMLPVGSTWYEVDFGMGDIVRVLVAS